MFFRKNTPSVEKNVDALYDQKDDVAIKISSLSKCYQIYETPRERLKQFIFPRLRKLIFLKPKIYFKEFWALKETNFEIRKGETVGIIGRNGSGKSTLLQLVCGTLNPSEGVVDINGRVAALLELGSGFNPDFTGHENIYMYASVLGLTSDEIKLKYDDIVKFADIGEFIEQPIKNYSSGMVVRLAFAVIAHVDADILIIDEALSVGDAFFVQKCMRFLRKFMENGTVLFVSHDPGAVLNLCTRAVWLQDGEVVAQGKPKEITEAYLEKLYEAEQGESDSTNLLAMHADKEEPLLRDMRLDFINHSILRNDIELFSFSPDTPSFGKGGAKIVNVQMLDGNGNALNWVVGGERIRLIIHCKANAELLKPISGFQVKDHLGQIIFGDNTYLTYRNSPQKISKNDTFFASFDFVMPLLPIGDYTIMAAVADGTQEEHIQHHWVHDAIAFKVHHTSVSHGLVGVPMLDIAIKLENNEN